MAIPAQMNWRGELERWALCFVLMIPAFTIYIGHFYFSADRIPTGFIVYDMAYYLANAREYFDAGQFGIGYGNPFSPYADTPRIYFQPFIALIALTGYVTGLPLETVWLIFLVIAGLICIRSSMSLFSQVVGLETGSARVVFVIFLWGGGLLAIAGAVHGMSSGSSAGNLFRFDPFQGWWFLNLGRNLIFPTESFYHFIVFSMIVAVLRKRFFLSILLAILLSASHPFTGIQFLLVLTLWSSMERFYLRNPDLPFWLVTALSIVTAWHCWYYLRWLPGWPEHAAVMQQWRLPWLLQGWPMFLAYIVPALFFFHRVRRPQFAAAVFSAPAQRLIACWLFVSLLLANHEFLMDPVQPLHFTRGYIWSALFMLAAPSIIGFVDKMMRRPFFSLRPVLLIAFLAVFFSDNFFWFKEGMRNEAGLYLTVESKAVVDTLTTIDVDHRQALLISDDLLIAYLATVYTPLRIWYAHVFCTPFAGLRAGELKSFYQDCVEPDRWADRTLVIVSKRNWICGGEGGLQGKVREVFRNAVYTVAVRDPAGVP